MRRALALRMGMPLRVLSRLMTYAEFRGWVREFAEQPFDDLATVHGPTAALLAATYNAGWKPAELFDAAQFMPQRRDAAAADDGETDLSLLMRNL